MKHSNTRFLQLVLIALACDSGDDGTAPHSRSSDAGGGDGSGGTAGSGGSSGDFADGGDARQMPPCDVVCGRYETACGTDENCAIFCEVWRTNFPECAPEFDAFYACSAADTEIRVDCAEAFALQPGACVREYHTLHYCDRAGGLDCRHEPAFDESCTVGPNPRPPRFHFCRIDASPPPACVPYLGTSLDYPFAYCCP